MIYLFFLRYQGKVDKKCRMKMSDDPESIQHVRQCDDKLTCVYESYKKLANTKAKCMSTSEYGI